MLTCPKTSRGVLVPLNELKRLLGATHKIQVSSAEIKIREKNYEEELDAALRIAKKATKNDFVNL